MRTALNVFPAEVWLRVIRLACADTSFTARTLSFVSREIYELSRPYHTQSVSLLGIKMIFRSYKSLTSTSQELRVVHLFIGCPNLRFERERLKNLAGDNGEVLAIAGDFSLGAGTLTALMDIDEAVLGKCVQRILSLVAGTLKSLHLHFIGFSNIYLLPNYLPVLEHLVLYGTHTSGQFERAPQYNFPRLATLQVSHHIFVPSKIIRDFSALFPTLVHFTLVQSMVSTVYFNDLLDVLKKLDTVWPEIRTMTQEVVQKKLVLKVDVTEWLHGGPISWYDQLLEVAATTHRIEIIQAKLGWID